VIARERQSIAAPSRVRTAAGTGGPPRGSPVRRLAGALAVPEAR